MSTATTPTDLQDRYAARGYRVQLSGVQALVRLVVDARRADAARNLRTASFVSGYEGSPLAGFDLELQRRRALLDELDIVFQPAVNEEIAATSVQGSQLVAQHGDARVDGVSGFWYGKSPGLDRASDALRHANLIGTHPRGGAVALVGDDPAAKSSTVPGASEHLLADLGMPVLYPADPQDVIDLGLHAIELSRASGLWVALKMATNVADGVSIVDVGPDRIRPVAPQLELEGRPFEHRLSARMLQPALALMERSREGIRRDVALEFARVNRLNRILDFGSTPRLGIVASGKTYLDLRQALRMLGLDDDELGRRGVRLLRLAMLHPLVPDEIERFAEGLDEIIVVEEKRSFVQVGITEILYGRARAPRVSGRTAPVLFPAEGELDADLIARGLARRLCAVGGFPTVDSWHRDHGAGDRAHAALPIVPRTPYFCSGCPHNTSTKVPAGSLVGGGIGCHALVLMMDPALSGEVLGLTQMGGEGAQWIGMAPFMTGKPHLLQNLGDGTFHHSGSLAVRAAIASGVNVTFKLLYNSAVAMTGGQQAVGRMSVAALTRSLAAEGVRRIIVTTEDTSRYKSRRSDRLPDVAEVWSRDRVVEAQEELQRVPGVTVLIHDQECATELRRKRKRGLVPDATHRIMINERVCEGCGDCGRKSNCLSVQPVDTDYGRKTAIDQSSCNADYSCLDGDCPSFVEVRPKPGARKQRTVAADVNVDSLPEPAVRFDISSRPHTTRFAGIGGTGVVTVSQILGAAAKAAGLEVRALDQTGLAQKGGAVISDVKISSHSIEMGSKAAVSECNLYVGCDLLAAADPRNLAATDRQGTMAVVSTARTPTGQMVVDTGAAFPDVTELTDRIRAATRGPEAIFLDARATAVALLGSDQFANILLLGVAFQAGALPVPAADIEEAIALNGVQVEANRAAFRRGRQAVADPVAFERALAASVPENGERRPDERAAELAATVGAAPGSELGRIVADRTADLVGYQGLAYARTYTTFVERVRQAEVSAVAGSTALSAAVARNLYKLMAYKDEYEVARLSLDPRLQSEVERQFGPGAKVSYRLHPPVLRALGMRRKIRLGPWFRPVFRLLRSLRLLRGTPLDPFGLARVRRLERELVRDYRLVVEQLLERVAPATLDRCVRIAALPDMVRGYEEVKVANVARYRAELQELMGGLDAA